MDEVVVLTKQEAFSLANHLEYYIMQEVRDAPDYDNIDYLINLVHVYERCKMMGSEEI